MDLGKQTVTNTPKKTYHTAHCPTMMQRYTVALISKLLGYISALTLVLSKNFLKGTVKQNIQRVFCEAQRSSYCLRKNRRCVPFCLQVELCLDGFYQSVWECIPHTDG